MDFELVAKNFSPVRLKKVWEKRRIWNLPFSTSAVVCDAFAPCARLVEA